MQVTVSAGPYIAMVALATGRAVAFVQAGAAPALVVRAAAAPVRADPDLTIGDLVLLRPGAGALPHREASSTSAVVISQCGLRGR